MIVDFTTEARQDLFEAADYYEDCEQGLGKRFRDEIAGVLLRWQVPLVYGANARQDTGG